MEKTNEKSFAALCFGEVMMRLSPTGTERIAQSEMFMKHAAGSEMNVMSGIARMRLRTGVISKLPDTMVGRYIRNQIRSYGVSDDYIIRDRGKDARLGIYYYESGMFPRKPMVAYDRKESSFTAISADEFPADIFNSASLFHTSGITLALSENTRAVAMELMKGFKAAGAKVSFDVNYRATLWGEEEARAAIEEVLPYVDILFISEETCRRMFGRTGEMPEIMRGFAKDYDISVVASTQRVIVSPRRHNFGSLLYAKDDDAFYSESPYENIEVVDRIGSGDAYVSGVLAVMLSGGGYQKAVEVGNAMAAVKNTIPGDILSTDIDEIERIISDHKATGPVSEMNR